MAAEVDSFHSIIDTLGEPFFLGEGCAIYCDDCIEMMEKLPKGIVDLTVTSPPYNIGKEYEDIMTVEDYKEWCGRWLAQIHALTKSSGAMWLNLGYMSVPEEGRAVPIPYIIWDLIPFFMLQEIVWNYGAGVACRKIFSPRNEKFLWLAKDPKKYTFNLDEVRDPNVKYPHQKKNGKLRCNPLGKNPTDVWQFPKVTSGAKRSSKERTRHPAQFPVAVIERIIKACSNPGDLVFDPFLGSGTVAEVALRLGRKVIGIEIREDYCEIAKKRIMEMV